ncbi:ArsR/SmtB family transcription factor [Filobacillus milosensis]|uniref:ArsR/SmtB family transcription factor n=1 Tax=Filobacillus milosensis TaxID=94137 RepID=UPI001E55CF31|nr:metalloregulator ArsR/SmtB family transcription factor [Filobacillus milosensis]
MLTTSNIYRALSDSTRKRILSLLAKEEKTQKQLVEYFKVSQPAINKQLKILKEEDLITERKSGRYRYYSLNRPVFSMAYQKMIEEIGQMLDQTLHGLKDFVESEEKEID